MNPTARQDREESRIVSSNLFDADHKSASPPADPHLLRFLFSTWEPERPELLIRLRPRVQEASRVTR